MKLYWVSGIVQSDNEKAWLLSMSNGEISLEKALEVVANLKKNYRVLSVWINTYENDESQIVYHECCINVLGNIDKAIVSSTGVSNETDKIKKVKAVLKKRDYAFDGQEFGASYSDLENLLDEINDIVEEK